MDRRKFIGLSSLTAGSVLMSGFDDEPEFARHRIEQIIVRSFKLKYPRLVGKNARSDVHGYGPTVDTVELITSQGASGWGIVRDHAKLEAAKTFIKGKGVRDVFSRSAGITNDIVSPFDFALHDLAGVILDKPVYELIGGGRDPITTNYYSGMIYFDDLEPAANPAGIDAVLKNCQWDYEYGYRQFKLKLGRGHKWMSSAEGLKRDIDVTKAVSQLYPDCDILIDANDRYDVDTTINYIKGIGDIKLFWIEEPFKETPQDYDELVEWLRANGRGDTLIADGEWSPNLPLALELGAKKLLNVYLQDMADLGFTGWRKLNLELKEKGIMSSPHCWGDMFKSHYTAHLIGAQGNAPTIEGVTCFCDEIDFGNYQIKGKHLVPSRDPGFGMKMLKK
jgi:D-galactarolactone cycloisomerase